MKDDVVGDRVEELGDEMLEVLEDRWFGKLKLLVDTAGEE